MAVNSVPAMFQERVRKYGDRVFMRHKLDGAWRDVSWREQGERVRRAAKGLLALGVERGDRVAILAENRPEWALASLAVSSVGAADAPIYATNPPDQCSYVVRDSGAVVCFASTPAQLDKLLAERGNMPGLRHIVMFDAPASIPDTGELEVHTLAGLEELGERMGGDAEVDARTAAIGREDLLTLIYTSGTTGEPKGVMLTHGNLLSNCEAAAQVIRLYDTDEFLSFLPLSHSFERMVGFAFAMYVGATISYAESVDRLVDNLSEVRPTLMASVPRIYEKVYANFMAQRAAATGVKRKIMDLAIATGYEVVAAKEQGRPVSGLLALRYKLATRLVFSKLQQRLGGRIRFMVSGGAPLSGDIARFFYAAGLLVLEGYGLSETSPVITVNRPDDFRFGTVGKVIPGVTVKIAPDGEILCKGHNVMRGYFGKPEATAEVLSPEGWFATGDIGEFDSEGFLRITDRKKDLIKTAGGKYVAPQELENKLKLQPHVEQVNIVGDQRPYCVALIVPKVDELRKALAGQGKTFGSDQAMVESDAARALLQAEVDEVNRALPTYASVKAFALLPEPFTQENGMLTPTLKVRRKNVNRRYADLIDSLYEQGKSFRKPG
ncbi:MAG: AMP-binding protein [Myxococcales bacterium]